MDKNIELARKLKALSDKGIGGEKTNATEMLEKFLDKHGLSLEDIESEEKRDFFFKLTKDTYKLWHQIVKSVNKSIRCYGAIPQSKVKQLELKGNYMVTCTNSEYIEIEAKNDFYQNLYKEEVKVFYSAFIQANDLGVSSEEERKYTKEEMLQLQRTLALASNIKKGSFNKQIE